MASQEQLVRDRSYRLFDYLEQLTKMRLKMVTPSLESYEEVLWFHDIPEHQDCTCVTNSQNIGEEASETWIEVKKPILPAAPKIPDLLIPWMDPITVADFRRKQPGIRKRLVLKPTSNDHHDQNINESETILSLDACPHISDAYRRYVKQEWGPWADHRRLLEKIQNIHRTLFSIYQKQQQAAESFEILVGLGCLAWKKSDGKQIKRHVLVAQAALTFEVSDGTIAVGPGVNGSRPTFEDDMLEAGDLPNPALRHEVEEKLESLSELIWDPEIHSVLKSWLMAIQPDGTYDSSAKPPEDLNNSPTVHFAPALILRKRTEKGLVRTLQEIKKQLGENGKIPLGIERIVTVLDDRGLSLEPGEDHKHQWANTELYFPLVSSEEQREIAEAISHRHGVVVQGPPGTGKSHTIANLICHLLASGKRLLVTSVKPRPLEVLRRFLPEDMGHLCVLLLGNDAAALSDLETSVMGISDRFSKWNRNNNIQHIRQLEEKLDKNRRSESLKLRELLDIRQAETTVCTFTFGPYTGKPQAIADEVRQSERLHGWIRNRPQEDQEPPLSAEESVELLKLMRELKNKSEEIDKEFIDPSILADPIELVHLIECESQAVLQFQQASDYHQHPTYSAIKQIQSDIRERLLDNLESFRRAYESIAQHSEGWIHDAVVAVLSRSPQVWARLHKETRVFLDESDDLIRSLSLTVSGLDRQQIQVMRNDAETLTQYLEKGGSLRLWGLQCPRSLSD